MTVSPLPSVSSRAQLLCETEAFISRYVVLSAPQSTAVALFVAHTHAIDIADVTPYLALTSATPRCGKTRLLEVLELVTCRALRSADFTESALFRLIPQQPTLLLDESDTIFRGPMSRQGLRALLNAGYRRGSPVQRVKGSEVQSFDPFCAKVIAGIGDKLPETVRDRSIPITMTRKSPAEDVERFRMKEVTATGHELRDRLYRSFGRHGENAKWLHGLGSVRPTLPAFLNDRQQDSWEPLLQIAEVIGGGWLDRAIDAARALHETTAGLEI